ncbi:MAG: hypothetical protein OXG37_06220 [Actinomycetia bacterium]|nr:hypothetical protein [Actinomycetes bacterium]
MGERSVRDVLLVPTWPAHPKEFERNPPAVMLPPSGDPVRPVVLADGLELTVLPAAEANLVMDAREPCGYSHRPVRQFSQGYSFVRTVDHTSEQYESRPYRWNADGLLWEAVVNSRLIRDNGYSPEYAARIVEFGDREPE